MATTLYLIRHGATEANVVQPYRLQGRCSNAPLASVGIHQAELTGNALAATPIAHFYSSPLKRAVETAKIIVAPHNRPVHIIQQFRECDVGQWEGLTWDTIRENYAEAYECFLGDPAASGYPGGETFAQVAARILPAFDHLFAHHEGETFLVVGHHVVNRIYLASVLGLPVSRARQVKLDNCGISIVQREKDQTRVVTLNAIIHLRGPGLAA